MMKNKPTKKVSAKAAHLLADMMKGKKVPVKAAPIDAEDLKDGGVDEAKEKE